MKDIKTLLQNYYYSRLEYEHRSKHDADYYSCLLLDEEPTEKIRPLIAVESDILNQLKEDLETTLKVVGSMKTEKYKTLLLLRYIKNLSWEKIKELTGYNRQYLRGTMHRAAINEANETKQTL